MSVLDDAVPFYGDIPAKQREANLQRFRDGARYLVANKTCAGYGLNLQFCHRVIYYSNDWDWATRAQSEDRVYRIGQSHEVQIIDMVTEGTLDRKILRCLARKERLQDAVKRELNNQNEKAEIKNKFRSWLRGEMEDKRGEDIQADKCV